MHHRAIQLESGAIQNIIIIFIIKKNRETLRTMNSSLHALNNLIEIN